MNRLRQARNQRRRGSQQTLPASGVGLYAAWNNARMAIRDAPRPVEFVVVILIAFGLFTYWAFMLFFQPPENDAVTNQELVVLFMYELVAFGVIACFLRIRGWQLRKFYTRITWKLTGVGILLATVITLYGIGVGLVGEQAGWSNEPEAEAVSVSLPIAVIFSVANGIYEESLVVGYVIGVLRWCGCGVAIMVSTMIRVAYHVYQGPDALLIILPIGVLLGYVFYRSRRLWPLVLAHALLNFISLIFES